MKKKISFILSMALAFTMSVSNVYAFDYQFTDSTSGIQVSSNQGNVVESSAKYAQIAKSFIDKSSDGTITRVEVVNGNVFVEEYSSDYTYLSTKQLPLELPRFGGAYFGSGYNFLVFLQDNNNEHDDREVMRIVKYDKDWNPIKSASVYGANTVKPASSANLSIVEKGGVLYIKTSHRMYKDDDGANHQASFAVGVNIDTMDIAGTMHKMDYKTKGYISHSFAEFLTTDGNEIYEVALGDAFPRSIVAFRGTNPAGGTLYNADLYNIPGPTGQNSTGFNLGGIEYATGTSTSAITLETTTQNNIIVAGRMEAEYNDNSWSLNSHIRNVFITVGNLVGTNEIKANDIIPITNYTRAEGIKTTTPKLVKVSDDKIYVMWQEYKGSVSEANTVKYVVVDHNGQKLTQTMEATGKLSDVEPIVSGNEILWYATTGGVPTFYTLNADTNEVTSHMASGNTFAYTPIVVEYEPEKPADPTPDTGNNGGTDTGSTDNDSDDSSNDDSSSDNSSSGGSGTGGSKVTTDKDKTKDTIKTEIKEKIAELKENSKEIKYFEISKDQKNFYPDKAVNRFDVIKYLSKVFNIEIPSSTTNYTDLTGLSKEEQDIVNLFSSANIVNGYEDGTFKPEAEITRAEFVTILARILNFDVTGGTNKYTDISDHWANETIQYFSNSGYINGYPDGTFRPDENISNAEVIVILNRITGAYGIASSETIDNSIVFDDLPENHWARQQILHSVSVN